MLDDSAYPIQDLMKFDIVIASYNFVLNGYLEKEKYDEAVRRINARPEQNVKPPPQFRHPLHSPLYAEMNKQISVLILDGSHEIKNTRTKRWAAINSLKYDVAYLLPDNFSPPPSRVPTPQDPD